MMNARYPIELDGLSGKQRIVLYSEDGLIDFKDGCINVGTYFDDPQQTKDEFFAPLRVFINRQKNTHVIHIPVPEGASHAMIFLTSTSAADELQKITALCA